ncbi:MAG: DUF721 domain-containing protein [Alphaproteobacteria bacterium]|nr:MAG: DUF721 domain-containing protein [Alphaproteobacteria bacterium]
MRPAGTSSSHKSGPRSSRRAERRSRTLPLSRLLPGEVVRLYRARGFLHQEIVSRWKEIVGEELAGMCLPIKITFARDTRRNGTLHIKVAPAFAPLVQHGTPLILERVNRHFGYGAIARIALSQAPLPIPKTAGKPRRKPPAPNSPACQEARRVAAKIRDPDLSGLLARWGAMLLSDSPPAGEAESEEFPPPSDDETPAG